MALHHIWVQYYTRLSKVGNGQKSRRRKGQSALQVDTVLIPEKLVPLSFTFLFVHKWSTTHVCCFLCLCFFEPVAAVCVCLTYSPRLFWSQMNGPRKLQTFIETLAVHLGSFRADHIFNSSCSTNMNERVSVSHKVLCSICQEASVNLRPWYIYCWLLTITSTLYSDSISTGHFLAFFF